MEELLRGRFAEERFPPELLTAYHWQVAKKNLVFNGYVTNDVNM